MRRDLEVVLVGRRPPWCENVALGYVAAALEGAGFEVRILHLNLSRDVRPAADEIMARRPGLVGLAIPETSSAIFALALGEMLSARGYSGHVTCGGQFATLTREWLLGRYRWLDSVVRFAGEITAVELASALASGAALSRVPGLTTRRGDGEPAPVLRSAGSRLWPRRDELAERLGHNVAQMVSSRGCEGRCAYCGPAALQRMEKHEAQLAGATACEIAGAGIGASRRRDLNDLCDEMAWLWHERDVRHFGFTDEHLLPFDEREALDHLACWKEGLRRRGVGRFGIGGQLRMSQVTPAIAAAFARFGLVRLHAGVDLGAPEDGRRYARPVVETRETEAIRSLNGEGVATISNIMLVHPYSTVASIAASVEAMERIPGGLVEAGQMFVYHGTALQDRLAAEGRLHGNPLRWDYSIEDPHVRRFTEIFGGLRLRAFGDYSIAQRAHEAFWNAALARRLGQGGALVGIDRRLGALRDRINAEYVEAYRTALRMACGDAGSDEESALVAAYRERTRFLERELAGIEAALEDALAVPMWTPRTFRTLAASLFTFCLATSPACRDVGGSGEPAPDAGTDSDADADSDTDADTEGTDDCTQEEIDSEAAAVEAAVRADVPCFDGGVLFDAAGNATGELDEVPDGYTPLGFDADGATAQEMEEAAALAAEAVPHECLASESVEIDDGGTVDDMVAMFSAMYAGCSTLMDAGTFAYDKIIVGADGTVQEVVPACDDADCLEAAACIEAALGGLTFPCLAGFELHAAGIIIE